MLGEYCSCEILSICCKKRMMFIGRSRTWKNSASYQAVRRFVFKKNLSCSDVIF